MKQLLLIVGFCLLYSVEWAQLKSIAPIKTAFSESISRILGDFPGNLYSISGDLLLSQGEIDNYESKEKVPGAIESFITRYHSEEDTTASWQAIMYRDESFKNAANKYKELFKQLKGCYLKTIDGSLLYLKNEWEAPTEDKRYISSYFYVITGDRSYKDLRMDLNMAYQFPEWIVNITIGSNKANELNQ